MDIPENISKEHLLKAIEKIDHEGIPKDGASQTYDVIHNGKKYPPKVIVSYANFFANGQILERSDFGGGQDQASFRLLREKGFEIIEKSKTKMNNKELFKNWLEKNSPVGSGKKSAYIRAVELLSKVEQYDIFESVDIDKLEKLYKDLIINQKLEGNKYFESKVPSYGSYGFYSSAIKSFINFLKNIPFVENSFVDVPNKFLNKYLSIKTKPFIILAGLSGTGKSRLVRTFAYQFNNIAIDIANENKQPTNFQLIKVKPNWHDSSELLGYESRISGKDRFIVTDFIRFIVKAWQHLDTPFFLCLDEMNLAPVEQYFAEYLSAIETRRVNEGKIMTDALISSKLITKYANNTNGVDETYKLWEELEVTDTEIQNELKAKGIGLPANLIVMGTVNMDETTHSFSRKVLDRAMTIEMNDINLSEGLVAGTDEWNYPAEPFQKELVLSEKTQGTEVFTELNKTGTEIILYLDLINTKLEGSPFKIAYRVRDEFLLFAFNYSLLENKPDDWLKNVLDEMTLMKILPRIEGDEEKTKLLEDLIILFKERNLPKALNKATEMEARRKLSHYTSFWS